MCLFRPREYPLEIEGLVNLAASENAARSADLEDAAVEMAQMLADMEDAMVEIAELIGGEE